MDELPSVLVEMQKSIKMHEAILQPSKLNYLKNHHRPELEIILSTMVDMLSGQFNIKKENDLTDDQLEDVVMTILSDRDFGQLAPEEILYVFRCAKTGKYGPVYNKLDCITICGWLRDYMDGERMRFFQQGNSEPKRFEVEEPITYLPKSSESQKSQLQIIKDQDAAKLREKLRTQMEEFREREKRRNQENND